MSLDYDQYRIFYNDTPIVINPELFAAASSVFASHYNPQSRDEISITCPETPVEMFQQFLPAVQNMPVKITEENVQALKAMAAEWGVDDLIARCEEWERNPRTILDQFQAAIAKKDQARVQQLTEVIAADIDVFVRVQKFMLIPPRNVEEILKSDKLNIIDHHEIFKAIMTLVNMRKEKCRYLLNCLNIDALSEQEILVLVRCNLADHNSLGPLMAKCARRLQQALATERSRDVRSGQLERTLRERTGEVRSLERQVSDEIRDHQIVLQKLKEMRTKYGGGENPRMSAPIPVQMFAGMGMPQSGDMYMGWHGMPGMVPMGGPMPQMNVPVMPKRVESEPLPAPQFKVERPKAKMYIPPEPRDVGATRPVSIVRSTHVSPLVIEKSEAPKVVLDGLQDDDSDDPFA